MKSLLKHLRRSISSMIVRSLAQPCKAEVTGSTLIIAPHPDDEVFGCGGQIAQFRDAGLPVDVLYLTSGETSHDNCCRMDQEKLAHSRHNQALESARGLGVHETYLHWFSLRDGAIPGKGSPGFGTAVDRLAEIIRTNAANQLYCPHPLDCWPDHEAAAEISMEAVRATGLPITVRFYLVWGWYSMPFRRIGRLWKWNDRVMGSAPKRLNTFRYDIGAVLPKKLAAIESYVRPHPPGCPNPYVGALPEGFLDPFKKPYEIFFDAGIICGQKNG